MCVLVKFRGNEVVKAEPLVAMAKTLQILCRKFTFVENDAIVTESQWNSWKEIVSNRKYIYFPKKYLHQLNV